MYHVYRLVSGDEAGPTHETLEVSSEVIRGGTRWALPSSAFDGLWDSLVYDSTVKRDLLKYSESALLFADYEVPFIYLPLSIFIFGSFINSSRVSHLVDYPGAMFAKYLHYFRVLMTSYVGLILLISSSRLVVAVCVYNGLKL